MRFPFCHGSLQFCIQFVFLGERSLKVSFCRILWRFHDRVAPEEVRGPVRSSPANEYLSHAVQELLGDARVETTMIYTHVVNKDKGGRGVTGPPDRVEQTRPVYGASAIAPATL